MSTETKTEVRIPEVGESVTEAVLAQWYRRDGDWVRKGEILFLIETDKVTLEVVAEAEGVLKILVPQGATVPVGKVVAVIEAKAAAEAGRKQETPITVGTPPPDVPQPPQETAGVSPLEAPAHFHTGRKIAPAARKLAEERGVDLGAVVGSGPEGLVTRGDVLLHLEQSPSSTAPQPPPVQVSAGAPPLEAPAVTPATGTGPEAVTRKPLSRIRMRIAERLLEARRNTAMLTTFNEIDMSRVQEIRSRFKDAFKARYGVSLGIMSFFIKASIEALKEYPEVNAFIDGQEIVYHHAYHIGVAIGGERGLVVPVIRHADRMGFADLERAIGDYVAKLKENRLDLADLEGGTFTISNGGIYGSLLSTPILNTPQSGILGLHKIEERPVVVDGAVVVRPMMYVALTYDHRIIDGREAVSFLRRIKECVESPERMMIEV